jgi:hypothetical protein
MLNLSNSKPRYQKPRIIKAKTYLDYVKEARWDYLQGFQKAIKENKTPEYLHYSRAS